MFLGFAHFYWRFTQSFSQITASFISILTAIETNPSATDPILIDEDSTIDRIGNSEANGAKVGIKTAKSQSQDKSKGINLTKTFLAKSQAFIQSSGSGFLISGAGQAFIKLRQVFIEALISYHFD